MFTFGMYLYELFNAWFIVFLLRDDEDELVEFDDVEDVDEIGVILLVGNVFDANIIPLNIYSVFILFVDL